MKPMEIVIDILPILVLLGGVFRYSIAETERRRDKRGAQLQELRNQIQSDPAIARVMFLCETKTLNPGFHQPTNDEATINLYMAVVKALGLFDSMCYSFIKRNLGKEEFIYFWGEMATLYFDPAIGEYLGQLLKQNLETLSDGTYEKDHLFETYYPYGYFQVAMKQNADDLSKISANKLRKMMKNQMKIFSQQLYSRLTTSPQNS